MSVLELTKQNDATLSCKSRQKFKNKQNGTVVQCLQCAELHSHQNYTIVKMTHYQNVPHSKYLTVRLSHSKKQRTSIAHNTGNSTE